jgi:membrane protease YdiL (CAAX protease family)
MVGAHYGWWGHVPPVWHLLGSLGPALAAVIVTRHRLGNAGIRELFTRATRWRAGWLAWSLAVVGPAALVVVGVVAVRVETSHVPAWGQLTDVPEFSHLGLPLLLAVEILFYGFGEELGWRGFALPRMAAGHGLLWASILISIPWGLWHLPLLLVSDTYSSMSPLLLLGWFASLTTGSVLLAFLFKASGGSVLVVAVFHGLLDVAMVNAAMTGNAIAVQGSLVTIAGAAAAVLLWRTRDRAVPGPRASGLAYQS